VSVLIYLLMAASLAGALALSVWLARLLFRQGRRALGFLVLFGLPLPLAASVLFTAMTLLLAVGFLVGS